jgi:hypothetical protein
VTDPLTRAPGGSRFAAEDVTTLVTAIAENAHRLGLKWLLRPATIVTATDPANVSAKVDGDDVATFGIVSMIGKLNPKSRVFMLIIPNVGSYVLGRVGEVTELNHLYHGGGSGSNSTTTYAELSVTPAGVAFIAPPSGKVSLVYAGILSNNTAAGGAAMAPRIGTDSVIGAGTQILAPADANAATFNGTPSASFNVKAASDVLQTGLTPGRDYNVSLRLRRLSSGGTASVAQTSLLVMPSP